MKLFFWHHEVYGPIGLEDIWLGRHFFGGGVARLRIIFWLSEIGYEVYLVGNVEPSTFRGVIGLSKYDGFNLISDFSRFSPLMLVLNDAPTDDNWLKIKKSDNIKIIYWAGVPFEQKWIERLRSCELSRIICVSQNHRNLYRIYPEIKKIDFIYSGVDLDILEDVEVKNLHPNTVLSISIPRKTKGFHNLLNSWPLVQKVIPNAKLRVCGSANMHNPEAITGVTGVLDLNLEAEFPHFFGNRSGSYLDYGIEFMGSRPLSEVYSDIKSSAVAVVNTNLVGADETYCRSAVEAQSAGVPVIGANKGALPEVVRNGVTGILVDDPSPKILANAIIKLLRNQQISREMGKNAKIHSLPIASYELLVGVWVEVINRTLHGISSPRSDFLYKDILRYIGAGKIKDKIKSLLRKRMKS